MQDDKLCTTCVDSVRRVGEEERGDGATGADARQLAAVGGAAVRRPRLQTRPQRARGVRLAGASSRSGSRITAQQCGCLRAEASILAEAAPEARSIANPAQARRERVARVASQSGHRPRAASAAMRAAQSEGFPAQRSTDSYEAHLETGPVAVFCTDVKVVSPSRPLVDDGGNGQQLR